MTLWLQWAFYAFAVEMVISWLIAVRYFLVVNAELHRARQAGEASHIPPSSRGLPPVVIFTKNVLPRVEKERHRLALALAFFAGGWLVATLLAGTFGTYR
jgi:hypothetical protein